MNSRSALIVCFDRWHLGFAGCYGCEFIETPQLDKLADEGIVFDACFTDHAADEGAAPGWFTGLNSWAAWGARGGPVQPPDLIAALNASGVHTVCLREHDERLARQSWPPFTTIHDVAGDEGLDAELAQIPFFRLVDKAVRLMDVEEGARQVDGQPRLLWLWSRGVPVPWLPPRDVCDLYFEEFGLEPLANQPEAPEPPEEAIEAAAPPEQETLCDAGEELIDPGGVPVDLRYAKALYAAYVSALDVALGRLLTSLERMPSWRDALVIVTSRLGQSLGEHGEIDQPVSLHEEWVHVPLIVRVPGSPLAGTRFRALVQPQDLAPTLAEWFGVPFGAVRPCGPPQSSRATDPADGPKGWDRFRGESLWPLMRQECGALREAAITGLDAQQFGLRTSEYYGHFLATDPTAEPVCAALFNKPADRFDMANVAGEEPRAVEQIQGLARAFLAQAQPTERA